MVQVKAGAGNAAPTLKPKAEHVRAQTILPHALSVTVAEGGKLCITRKAFLDRFPDQKPGVYLWCVLPTLGNPCTCYLTQIMHGALQHPICLFFRSA